MLKKFLASLAKNPWKSYADSIGAEYVDGGFHSDRIIVNNQDFTVIVTIGTNQRGNKGFRYTRFRCSYTSDQFYYFCIQPKKMLKGFFSNEKSYPLPVKKLYDISTPKEELFSILSDDNQFCTLLNTLSIFKYSSEKNDGEYGPDFSPTEHQFCLELEGEIEEDSILTAGIGIIFATVRLYQTNGLLSAVKSTVRY